MQSFDAIVIIKHIGVLILKLSMPNYHKIPLFKPISFQKCKISTSRFLLIDVTLKHAVKLKHVLLH